MLSLRTSLSRTVQPPHEFKTLKFETPEAVKSRKVVKDLGEDVKRHEKTLKVSAWGLLVENDVVLPYTQNSFLNATTDDPHVSLLYGCVLCFVDMIG